MSRWFITFLVVASIIETVIVVFVMKQSDFIKKYIPYSIILILTFLLFKECTEEIETVKVPIRMDVPVPVIEVQFDTILSPYPIYIEGKKEIDSLYYDKYLSLKDSISRDSLFKDAITIREYREEIEDDTITISLYTRVQGYMKEYQVGYKTKPRKIQLDTVIKVPIPKKSELFIGGETGIDFYSEIIQPKVKINLFYKSKKNHLFNIGIDNERYAWLGMAFKL